MGFKFGIKKNTLIMKSQVHKTELSFGGNYLSNEIFYRVARLRELLRPTLSTGHFHIAQLQDKEKPNFSPTETKDLLDIVKNAIARGVNAL
jgi:hypothetical protein